MKYFGIALIAFSLALSTISAHAGESVVNGTLTHEESVAKSSRGHFHLLTMNCKGGEDEVGPESTPQSPPLNVDDPATPGCNRWEINVVADGDLTNAEKDFEIPLLDINYGIGDNLQLKYEVPYTRNDGQAASTSKVGESKVGIKYSFFNDEAAELEIAFYPQVALINPPDDEEGAHKLQTETTLPFLMTKKVGQIKNGDVVMTANLAYTYSKVPDTQDFLAAGVGLGMPLSNRIGAMAEVTTEQAVASDAEGNREAILKANLGLVTTISKQFLLFGSVGHSLYSSDSVGHEYALVGFRWLTGIGVPNDPVVASLSPR